MRLAVALLALAAAVALSGCSGGSPREPLTEAEARAAAESAVADLHRDLADPANGTISEVRAEFQAKGVAITVELTYGRDGASRARFEARLAGEEVSFEATCTAEYRVLALPNATYAAKSYGAAGDCLDQMGLGGLTPGQIGVGPGAQPLGVTPHADGSVTATYPAGGFAVASVSTPPPSNSAGGTTVEVNPDGQVSRMTTASAEGTGTVEIGHKAKKAIPAPDVSQAHRLPASIGYERSATGSVERAAFTVKSAPARPALSDFSIRVMAPGGPVSCSALDARSTVGCVNGGFRFFFDDKEPIGHVNEGDGFEVEPTEPGGEVPPDVRIHDDWAQAPVQPDEPFVAVLITLFAFATGEIPTLGLLAMALTLLGAAAAARRRH